MKKNKKKFMVIVIIIIVMLIVPYIRVEILTLKYGSEFVNLYGASNMIDGIEYFKVMDYSETYAKVYYVSKGRYSGNMFIFVQKDGHWILDNWETIWSETGSADSFMWPLYR